jgi:hypothetical protein
VPVDDSQLSAMKTLHIFRIQTITFFHSAWHNNCNKQKVCKGIVWEGLARLLHGIIPGTLFANAQSMPAFPLARSMPDYPDYTLRKILRGIILNHSQYLPLSAKGITRQVRSDFPSTLAKYAELLG